MKKVLIGTGIAGALAGAGLIGYKDIRSGATNSKIIAYNRSLIDTLDKGPIHPGGRSGYKSRSIGYAAAHRKAHRRHDVIDYWVRRHWFR